MKKLIPALVFAAAISSPAFAEKGHNHDDGKEGAIGGMMMGMMSHDQMIESISSTTKKAVLH